MKVFLYKGRKNENYIRNVVMKRAMESAGVEFVDDVKDCDWIWVGVPGHYDVPKAWLMAKLHWKKLAFDMHWSMYDSAVNDRKTVKKSSLKAKFYKFVDKLSITLPDVVFLDTQAHINLVCDLLDSTQTKREKFKKVFIGADTAVFKPKEHVPQDRFCALWYGTYIPLQGAEHIANASVWDESGIELMMFGSGQTFKEVEKIIKGKAGIDYYNYLVSQQVIAGHMACSDVVLGIFGTSKKALSVIPNKVFEALACGMPVITSDTPGSRDLLTHLQNAYLVEPGSPEAISEAVRELKSNPGLCGKLRQGALKLYENDLHPRTLGGQILGVLK